MKVTIGLERGTGDGDDRGTERRQTPQGLGQLGIVDEGA